METVGYNGIKTVVVFTARPSESIDASHVFNEKASHSLLKSLNDAHYVCVPVEGRWGGIPERSFAVINIGPEAAAWFTGRFQLTRFIYSRVTDGIIETDCYEKQEMTRPYNRKTNPYVIMDSVTGYVDMSGAEPNFTVVGNKFSYKIDYPAFRFINETISKNYTDELNRGEKSFFRNMTLDEEIDFTMNRVGQSPSIHRGRLYEGLI